MGVPELKVGDVVELEKGNRDWYYRIVKIVDNNIEIAPLSSKQVFHGSYSGYKELLYMAERGNRWWIELSYAKLIIREENTTISKDDDFIDYLNEVL